MSPSSKSFLALFVFLVIAFSAAAFGSLFPPGAWHEALNKPSWNPPNWVFGPVWTVLYLMIAVAGWRIWRRDGRDAAPALAAWGIQMVLNALWSWIFFGLHRLDLAFGEIVALWISIAVTIILFLRRDRWAGLLMVPYLAWVTFAAALNFAIWQLNS